MVRDKTEIFFFNLRHRSCKNKTAVNCANSGDSGEFGDSADFGESCESGNSGEYGDSGESVTNSSGAIRWPNFQLMQVAPSGGQIWN